MLSKTQEICSEHNKLYRNVCVCTSYSLADFYEHSAGNLLITGGTLAQRSKAVCSLVKQLSAAGQEHIILFSNCSKTYSNLLNLNNAGMIGDAIFTTPDRQNYAPFSGWSPELCAEYFSRAASVAGYMSINEISSYSGGFFNILSAIGDNSLSSIQTLMSSFDNEITASVEDEENEIFKNLITSSAKGGVDARRIFTLTKSALAKITDLSGSSGYSLVSVNKPCVSYISTMTNNHDAMAQYFMCELKEILHRKMTIIFEDSVILNSPVMMEFIKVLKQMCNITLIISTDNLFVLPNASQSGEDARTSGFTRHIVFVNSVNSPPELQNVLTSLGTYTHFEATTSESTPLRLLFSVKRSESSSTTTFSRPKLLLEEEMGRTLLKGHCGNTIFSVGNLKDFSKNDVQHPSLR